ncbi:MAG: DUF2062 domain-containing protein [Planctomycetes bacterium]|nr:DUF2062 domain-containing protein [Planctomycetota bacterium]
MQWRRSWLRLKRQRDKPQSIAWGAALGIFIGFTPTPGFQVPLAFLLAWLVRVNRIAAMAFTFVTNAFTTIPICVFEYQVGARILGWFGAESVFGVERLREGLSHTHEGPWWHIVSIQALQDMARAVGHAYPTMFLGGVVLGLLCAAPTYAIMLRVVYGQMAVRALRMERRARLRGTVEETLGRFLHLKRSQPVPTPPEAPAANRETAAPPREPVDAAPPGSGGPA